ncbi:DNA -binding domain-containing protein [Bradyrhizobium sp. BWA-3-5]|uniref:DNA -binding domain-containing protein n=1 Tax=Bradyrhizobium sp. BWA-3-5 TaxID=3080013 RepID=UPI00293EFF4C|nr:DUF2285 domain-containing protein [Bradyrhizobium sp. BWA-3-5]WOH63645.1 DUF2285 domain-containing protein [Bradyrhizobium sp. BWA-3-5]
MPHLAQTIRAEKAIYRGRLLNHCVGSSRGRTDDDAFSWTAADYDGADWAWEFLRRNEDYIADWRTSVPRHLPCITLKDGTRLLRLRQRFPRAEKWGLYAFADPRLCAHDATVIWHANALKRVVRLSARMPNEHSGAITRALADFNGDRLAVIDTEGVQYVSIKGIGGVRVNVEIKDLSVLTAPFAAVFELHDLDDLSGQTEVLKGLHRLTDSDVSNLQRPTLSGDERLRQALIALDESLNGKTYRQIAITLFGEKKVAEEWLGPSQYLKDRTRRLVAKGTELMKGGYRDLLS